MRVSWPRPGRGISSPARPYSAGATCPRRCRPSVPRHGCRPPVMEAEECELSLRPTTIRARGAAVVLPALLFAAFSSVDPAARLTRELLSMPKEEAYARGESLVAKK